MKNPKDQQNQELIVNKTSQPDVHLPDINYQAAPNAIDERRKWRETYDLEDRQLFALFSEFTALMMVTRH